MAYAVTSDSLVGVVPAYTVARWKGLNEALFEDESTRWQLSAAFSFGCCGWPCARGRH